MSSIIAALTNSRLFAELPQDQLDRVAALSSTASFDDGAKVFGEGDHADTIHVIERGRVAMQLRPSAGDPLLIGTVDPGDVLGVSWMLPPYRWTVDAIATAPTDTIQIDAIGLREACDGDPAMGYAMFRSFAGLARERLISTRLQLLDVYRNHDD